MLLGMKARVIIKRLKGRGCVEVRQIGSHVAMKCNGDCQAPIPVHPSTEITGHLLYRIEWEFERCLGKRWLTGKK